jgi:hypothetical protein
LRRFLPGAPQKADPDHYVADIPLVGNTTGTAPPPGSFGGSRYSGGTTSGDGTGDRELIPGVTCTLLGLGG